jgi:hypothetical protein
MPEIRLDADSPLHTNGHLDSKICSDLLPLAIETTESLWTSYIPTKRLDFFSQQPNLTENAENYTLQQVIQSLKLAAQALRTYQKQHKEL